MKELIEVDNGWIVKYTENNHIAYLGRDGYWARFDYNAQPFQNREDADAACE